MERVEISRRLKEWGIERFGTVTEFAAAMDMSVENLSQYFRGKSRPGSKLQARLSALGCDVGWLMTGRERAAKEQSSVLDLSNSVPLVGRIVANDKGKEYFEDFPAGIAIPYRSGNFVALLIEGDSLINAPDGDRSMEIYPGDLCIFEMGRQPKNGDIVAVQLKSGDRMVKILKHLSKDEVRLFSANNFKNYPSRDIRKEQISTFALLVNKIKLTRSERRRLGIK